MEGLTALLGLARPTEYEPMTEQEHIAVASCYNDLRQGHPGQHFNIQLFGTNEQTQIRISFTSISPQILEEVLACAQHHGLHVSMSSEEIVFAGAIRASTVIAIGPMAREKHRDELEDTPTDVVH